jgi:uncharacterized protein YjbI with pentapeptide repeats
LHQQLLALWTNFENVNLGGADFKDANLSLADFSRAIAVIMSVRTLRTKRSLVALPPARDSTPAPRPNPNEYSYNFKGASLSRANLSYANCKGANFKAANCVLM